jgi:hypothetical protein
MSDYLDGVLSVRRRRRLARHAERCPDCGPMLRGLMRVTTVLRSLGRMSTVDASVVPSVLDRVREEPLAASSSPSKDAGS